jgi:hypothetical protein
MQATAASSMGQGNGRCTMKRAHWNAPRARDSPLRARIKDAHGVKG